MKHPPDALSESVSWTGSLVCEYLRRAYHIDIQLTSSTWVQSWLFSTLDTFSDKVGQERDYRRIKGSVTREQLKFWEETMLWMRILRGYELEYKYLATWAACSPGKLSRWLANHNISRSTFYRHRDAGADRIARVLNERGVPVP